MLQTILSNRQKYHNAIMDSMKDNLYRKKRYELGFAIAIALCETDVCIANLAKNIRETDKFIKLDNHLCLIMLDGVSPDGVNKVAGNLQTSFEGRHFDKKLFIGVVNFSDCDHNDDGYKMSSSLLDVLEYSVNNNITHSVADYYQMEQTKHLRSCVY